MKLEAILTLERETSELPGRTFGEAADHRHTLPTEVGPGLPSTPEDPHHRGDRGGDRSRGWRGDL